MLFNPMYLLMVLLPGLLLSGAASWLVRSAFAKYSRVPSQRGITGAKAVCGGRGHNSNDTALLLDASRPARW